MILSSRLNPKLSANFLNRSVAVFSRFSISSDESLKSTAKPRAANLDPFGRYQEIPHNPGKRSFRKRPIKKLYKTHASGNWQEKRKKNPAKKLRDEIVLPKNNWIQISNVPPLANLDDIVNSVNRVLDVEREIGIIDLDASQFSEDGSSPRLELCSSEKWIKSAKVVLSTHGRPTSWRIELENRSIVNAFLQHTRENGFLCIWKESAVKEWQNNDSTTKSSFDNLPFEIDDNVLRVENCDEKITSNHLRHAFRRFDFSHQMPNIWHWKNEHIKHRKIYLLRFADAAWARSALRDMQGTVLHGKGLQLAQYPKQM